MNGKNLRAIGIFFVALLSAAPVAFLPIFVKYADADGVNVLTMSELRFSPASASNSSTWPNCRKKN